MQRLIDTKGRKITRQQVTHALTVSLAAGGFGSIWFLIASPQQILTVFVKNALGASSVQLGLFAGAMNLFSLFHLAGISIYSRRCTIKPFYLAMGVTHRSMTFLVAASAFYAAAGGDRRICLIMVVASSLLTFLIGNTAGSGWWAWFNEIIPPNERSSYFGRRSALAQTTNVISFFAATLALDLFTDKTFMVYGIIYMVAGVLGLCEMVMHFGVPEPAGVQADPTPFRASLFFRPIRDKNFRTFIIVSGMAIAAVNISAPFFAPYVVDPATIGAPAIWLGIMFSISQLIWVVAVRFWGTLMDRLGRKPMTMIGMIFPVSYIGYAFLTPHNYMYLLPIISFIGGIFSPALYEGINQVMMTLIPKKDRTVYIAWYWATLGVIQSIGPITGGFLMGRTGNIRVPIIATLVMMSAVFFLFNTIKIGKERRFSQVMSLVTSPAIIKAYYNIPIISRSADPAKVGKALQDVRGSEGTIAIDEILERLNDADQEVREEAVRALGRIGDGRAEDILIQQLNDRESYVRVEAARALGRIRSVKSVPMLIDGLYSKDSQLEEACARALGRVDSNEGYEALRKMITEERPLWIRAAGAIGVTEVPRPKELQALQDILRIRTQKGAGNPIVQKQLAIAIGNILGKPGEFYQFVSGTEASRDIAIHRLFRDVRRQLRSLQRTSKGFVDHIVQESLPKAIECFDSGEFDESFRYLSTIVLNLLFRAVELAGNRVAVEQDPAADANPPAITPAMQFSRGVERPVSIHSEQVPDIAREGWVVELEQQIREHQDLYAGFQIVRWMDAQHELDHLQVSEMDVLLIFYFLKHFRA